MIDPLGQVKVGAVPLLGRATTAGSEFAAALAPISFGDVGAEGDADAFGHGNFATDAQTLVSIGVGVVIINIVEIRVNVPTTDTHFARKAQAIFGDGNGRDRQPCHHQHCYQKLHHFHRYCLLNLDLSSAASYACRRLCGKPQLYLLIFTRQGIEFVAAGRALDPVDVRFTGSGARNKAEYHQNHQQGGKQTLQFSPPFTKPFHDFVSNWFFDFLYSGPTGAANRPGWPWTVSRRVQ